MLLIKRFVVCLLVTASAFAQAQSFATIDVKPARSVDPQSRRIRVLPNGDLKGTSVNAITLISEGYGVPANPSERLSTLPPWVYSERYDIEAKAPSSAKQMNPSDGKTSKLVRDMFRQVLADRFHLVMRTENRTMPVYALVVARGGPKLQRSNLSHCIFDTAQDGCHSFLIGFGHPLNARCSRYGRPRSLHRELDRFACCQQNLAHRCLHNQHRGLAADAAAPSTAQWCRKRGPHTLADDRYGPQRSWT
jgi:hypothetical protein